MLALDNRMPSVHIHRVMDLWICLASDADVPGGARIELKASSWRKAVKRAAWLLGIPSRRIMAFLASSAASSSELV